MMSPICYLRVSFAMGSFGKPELKFSFDCNQICLSLLPLEGAPSRAEVTPSGHRYSLPSPLLYCHTSMLSPGGGVLAIKWAPVILTVSTVSATCTK